MVAEGFPQGRSIFSTAADDGLEQNIQTLLNGVTAHQADLGAPLVTTVTGLLSEWQAVYANSEASGGAATTSQEGKRLARENLQLMLFLNLLKLAEMFARQPEKLNLYMQQSLLEETTAPETEEPPTPPATPTPPGRRVKECRPLICEKVANYKSQTTTWTKPVRATGEL